MQANGGHAETHARQHALTRQAGGVYKSAIPQLSEICSCPLWLSPWSLWGSLAETRAGQAGSVKRKPCSGRENRREAKNHSFWYRRAAW